MPIFIHCAHCRRVMGETDLNRLKKFRKSHGEVCDECKRIVGYIDDYMGRRKKVVIRELEEMHLRERDAVIHEIRKVVEMPPPKKTLWEKLFWKEKPIKGENNVIISEEGRKDTGTNP